jgi:signal transduction histidine kinase
MATGLPVPEAAVEPDDEMSAHGIGWRLKALVLAALLGCVGLFLVARALVLEPVLPGSWHEDERSAVVLRTTTADPVLATLAGARLVALGPAGGGREPVDALLLQHAPRWLVGDDERTRQAAANAALQRALAAGAVDLQLADGSVATVSPTARGVAGLGFVFWLLAALALMLYLTAAVAALARPGNAPWPYVALAALQSANLLLIAIESVPGLGQPLAHWNWHAAWRLVPDLATAAAVVHAAALHPRRLPNAAAIAAAAWALAAAVWTLAAIGRLPGLWWWLQSALVASGLVAIALLGWSHRRQPHPLAPVLRRLGIIAVGTLVLLSAALAFVHARGELPLQIAAVGSTVWSVFLASLLLALPMLARAQPLLREFSLVAGVSTVATSLDLLVVAVFSLGHFESLALALFAALGAYVAARQWVTDRLLGRRVLTTERLFELLYRAARDVESQPQKVQERSRRLLRDLFEPIEVRETPVVPPASRIVGSGSGLVVPLPALADEHAAPAAAAVLLHHAQRGQRLFTSDDARLADHAVEQLQRVLAVDVAVERGRREERLRLAQDLHDDIGARLLTMMYRAPTPEMEDYLRHTLQDLKTLTRGLAASSHRLSEAAAEWRNDLGHRLQLANCELEWSFVADRDPELGVVQWSALTRMLRELVTNVIAHAQASHVQVVVRYDDEGLRLVVSDDGRGRNPSQWRAGLGLGGVRKRVRQLGGEVRWSEREPRGIRCEVLLPQLEERGR